METFEETCRKHPYQRVTGVCAYCLSDRLRLLCPDCAGLRPCRCLPSSAAAASSENLSTSSSSSSFSFDHLKRPPYHDGVGTVDRISNLIDAEPPFRRCRSSRVAGIPFLRSTSRASKRWSDESVPVPIPLEPRKKWSLWSFLVPEKSKKEAKHPPEKTNATVTKLRRSTSVGVSYSTHSLKNPATAAGVELVDGGGSASGKVRGWSFSSPISVFRPTKTVNGRSPMCRG